MSSVNEIIAMSSIKSFNFGVVAERRRIQGLIDGQKISKSTGSITVSKATLELISNGDSNE
jgi:hypothetical protein